MSNHVSHAALPFPVKGARFTLLVPYLDADGDPTDPTTPDTERSIDGAAFADCTEEVTTISGSNGMGYLTLTGDELNCSLLALAAKVASGPKATLATLYPRVLRILETGTATAGSSTSITLNATYDVAGCIVKTTGGTGGGGGSGSLNNQARIITAYDIETGIATVEPAWETTPDNTTAFAILDPAGLGPIFYSYLDDTPQSFGSAIQGIQAGQSSLSSSITTLSGRLFIRISTAQAGAASTITLDASSSATNDLYAGTVIVLTGGTGAGQARVITSYVGSTKVATVDRAWATNPDNTSTFAILSASEFVNAATVQTGAIDADAVAADAVTEIQSGLATAAALAVVDDFLDTEIAAIKAKTDNLPSDPADQSAVEAAITAATSPLATAAALDAVDNFVDTEVSAIKAVTDALGATAAARLALSAANMIPGTVDTTAHTPTTTEFEADDITEATADHYNGRLVLWTSGALVGQVTDVTDYAIASGRGHFTVTAMTEAPANNDTFLLV